MNRDRLGVIGHHFVNGIVDDFVDQMVQALECGVPDIHSGAFTDVLHVTQVLQILRVVVRSIDGDFVVRRLIFVGHSLISEPSAQFLVRGPGGHVRTPSGSTLGKGVPLKP